MIKVSGTNVVYGKEREGMAKLHVNNREAPTKRQLAIYEVHEPDGGVGLQFGDGPVFMGYDESDLMRLLGEIFTGPEHDDRPLDGDLLAVAELYLDEDAARKRRAKLERWASGDYDDEEGDQDVW